MGGLFGAMAGMWMYNSFFGGGMSDLGASDAMTAATPAANDDTGDGDYAGGGAAGDGGGDFGDDGGGDVRRRRRLGRRRLGGGGDFGGGGGDLRRRRLVTHSQHIRKAHGTARAWAFSLSMIPS